MVRQRESESFIKINSSLLLFIPTPCKVFNKKIFCNSIHILQFAFFLILIILMGDEEKYT